MRREFDLETFYNLFEAFDRTGRRLFSETWRGTEAFARQTDDPSASREERDRLIGRHQVLSQQSAQHWALLRHGMAGEVQQAASDALEPINQEMEDIREQIQRIPEVSDTSIRDHDAYLRRRRVEDELKSAFASGDLPLHVAPNSIVEWRSWSRKEGFRVYFGLSMVRIPAEISSARRAPAFVPRADFHTWLNRFEASSAEAGTLTPEAMLKTWLEQQVKLFEPKEKTKDQYLAEARNALPFEVTKRMFEQVWANTVPQSWKASGPAKPKARK